jgi:hypothetical protein
MENNEKNKEELNKKSKIKSSERLFPSEETRKIVKSFIKAYQTNSITIKYPKPIYYEKEVPSSSILRKSPILRGTKKRVVRTEETTKNQVHTLISIIMNNERFPVDQQNRAISKLNDLISLLIGEKMIDGDFYHFAFEDRVNKLEKELKKTNKLVLDLVLGEAKKE